MYKLLLISCWSFGVTVLLGCGSSTGTSSAPSVAGTPGQGKEEDADDDSGKDPGIEITNSAVEGLQKFIESNAKPMEKSAIRLELVMDGGDEPQTRIDF